ncbi:peptidoglycan DD-metalloendopeptidase family protein, partial [Escherichia coli]|uniref:peptidoglycan DD-metalloendopeptidase family protein n=2 Tax=Escherichia coli TaxID=562 RepID=UPI00202279AA
ADRNRSHWSTSKTPSYTKSVSWQHHQTRYLHLNKILVTKGARVTRGGAIALSGNSGRSSGPHLHYELVINNNPVNSLAFRAAAPADNKLEQHAFAHARDYERYLD